MTTLFLRFLFRFLIVHPFSFFESAWQIAPGGGAAQSRTAWRAPKQADGKVQYPTEIRAAALSLERLFLRISPDSSGRATALCPRSPAARVGADPGRGAHGTAGYSRSHPMGTSRGKCRATSKQFQIARCSASCGCQQEKPAAAARPDPLALRQET